MNSLNEAATPPAMPSPSFFWWMKAGAGFALGAWLVLVVAWVGLTVAGVSMIGTIAKLALR